jgi:preprotein translocase subunit YajC
MTKKIWIPILSVLIVALLAGVWVSSEAMAQSNSPDGGGRLKRLLAARRGIGQVTSIGEDQFTVEKRTGESYTFLVNDETRFFDKDRNELEFDDLAIDRWVIVAGPENEAGERVARLVVLLPEDFDPSNLAGALGRIVTIDQAAQQFSLETRQGEEKTFDVNAETRYIGGVDELSDLQVEMPVLVKALEQDDGSLLAQVVGTRRDIKRFAGEITAIDEIAQNLTLKLHQGGREMTFSVDENTRFRGKDGELTGLGDLKVGMVAIVTVPEANAGETLVARLVAAADRDELPKFDKRVGGRVTSVDQNAFTIKARDGETYTFQVTGSTTFRSRGDQIQGLEDLDEGMGVIVGAKELGNSRYQAETVIVLAGLR